MKRLIEVLANIWKIEELKNRILVTLGFLVVYRIGAQVVLPGIDPVQLSQLTSKTSGGGLLGVLNMFTGGALQMHLFLPWVLCPTSLLLL
jgi:preprotein translocase subunit SecY